MKQFTFCPICGTQYQDQETSEFVHTCENCGYSFYENLVVSTIGVIIHQEKILLTRRKFPPHQGKWDLPGGFAEPTEHPEETVIRELQEELGINATIQRLLFVFSPIEYVYQDKKQYNCDLIYLVKTKNFNFQPNDDVEAVQWFGRDELPEEDELAFASVKEVLKRFKEGNLQLVT